MAVRNLEFSLICIRLDGYPRFPLCSSEFSDRVRAEELSKSSKPQPQSQVKLVEVKSESFLDTGPHCMPRLEFDPARMLSRRQCLQAEFKLFHRGYVILPLRCVAYVFEVGSF